ncbi:hypothetical protein RMN57_03455 [Kitasatospora sp. CM 4170]|uniref:Secreted protein n=1 Tax=Kitasatospora aburaviensis TaxID=67265 RepID=A0ABW1EZ65_9ACTN|nr:hypothetical protein [Kitasatospora sp. CM 4170]WNM43826.1 hypothetical protein RMN57_03455 [Kitasatospora sp. CM 4170]
MAVGLLLGWSLLGAATAAAAEGGSLVTVIDNSRGNAPVQAGPLLGTASLVRLDSLLEIDRTANQQNGQGTAGSDHDGTGALVGDLHGTTPTGATGPPEGGRR